MKTFELADVSVAQGAISVLWHAVISEGGVEISRANHRRAYMPHEWQQFLADVPDGEQYCTAAGWACEPLPEPTEQDIIDAANAAINSQIIALESTVTQRRLREAALTTAGRTWLDRVNAQIAALRASRIGGETQTIEDTMVVNSSMISDLNTARTLAELKTAVKTMDDGTQKTAMLAIITLLEGE